MQLSPYLLFNGNCEVVLKFYEKVLGGKIESMRKYADTPMADKVSPDWRNKIIHAHMKIGDRVLMASDAPTEHYEKPQGFSLTLDGLKSAEEAKRIFDALAEKGTIKMPLQKTFWAESFGMLVDQFGIAWMVLF